MADTIRNTALADAPKDRPALRNIVVGTDGSAHAHRALLWGIDLAKQAAARLTVVDIVVPPFAPPEPYGVATDDLMRALMDHARGITDAAVAEAKAAGVDASARVATGAPPELLCEIAESIPADMLIIGSRGHGALRRALLGSISNRVVHIAQVPVLTIP